MSIARGLVGWWRFDGDLTDASGSGNDMSLTAGTAAYATGIYGQAFSFNGASTLAKTSFTPTVNMTGSAWVKAANNSVVGYIFAINNPGSVRRFNLAWIGSSNVITFAQQPANKDSSAVFGGTGWVHVAVTLTGQNVSFYKNGQPAGTATLDGAPDLTSGTLRIGSRDGAVFFNGLIDNAMIYNRALSPSEIKTLYALGSPL